MDLTPARFSQVKWTQNVCAFIQVLFRMRELLLENLSNMLTICAVRCCAVRSLNLPKMEQEKKRGVAFT